MRMLEQNTAYQGKHNLKSGRFRNFDTNVQHYVQWPHELVYVGTSRRTVAYDELTPQQFMLGYIKIILKEKSASTKDMILNYLAKLLQESIDNSWEASRGAHAVVLQEMERGSVTWNNSEEIDGIRKLYTQKVVSPSDVSKPVSDTKKVVCLHYNSGKCVKTGDHQKDSVVYRHICSYCFRNVRKAYNHSEQQCNRKNKQEGPRD